MRVLRLLLSSGLILAVAVLCALPACNSGRSFNGQAAFDRTGLASVTIQISGPG